MRGARKNHACMKKKLAVVRFNNTVEQFFFPDQDPDIAIFPTDQD